MIDFKQKMEESENSDQYRQDLALIKGGKKRRRLSGYAIALIVVGIIFAGRIIMSSQSASGLFGENSWWNKVRHLTGASSNSLQGENDDRVNILLLGMGGKGHDGAYLTDTIMIASIKPSTGQVALISIPRDLSVPIDGSGWRKINNINAFAENKKEGSGGKVTSEAIGKLLGIDIQYYVRADFEGFTNIINEVGGITVNVPNTLEDYEYPILGQEDNPSYKARYEHLYITAGEQKMDGETALKYARSRHAYGPEGTDFARSHRQQLILQAVKEKLLSRDNLLKPVMIAKVVGQVQNHVDTNLEIWEMIRLWELTKGINQDKIINKVLDNSPDNFLIDTRGEDGAYLLVPRSGNFNKIKAFVQSIFGDIDTGSPTLGLNNNSNDENISPSINSNIKISGSPKLAILNGTWINGLAGQKAGLLKDSGFKVTKVGNTANRDYKNSLIYDLSYGKKPEALKALKSLSGAAVAFDSPDWIKDYLPNAASSSANTLTINSDISPTDNDNIKTPSTETTTGQAGEKTASSSPLVDFILILGLDAE